MYIRPSKYLKALRNKFPKFYPQIHIIVQKSTENLPQQKFFHCHKRFDNNFTDKKEHKRVKKKTNKTKLKDYTIA